MSPPGPPGKHVASLHDSMKQGGWPRLGHRRHVDKIWETARAAFPNAENFQIKLLLKDFFSMIKPEQLSSKTEQGPSIDAIVAALENFMKTYTLQTKREEPAYNPARRQANELEDGPGHARLVPRSRGGHLPPGLR